MHPKLLSKIPEGHPHCWTPEQLEGYELLGIGMPLEDWREMDDAVYLRECNLSACTEWHPGDAIEVREPASDDGPDLEAMLPSGDPNDWSEEDWKTVAARGEALSPDLSEALDDMIWDRMQQYDAGTYTEPVPDAPAVEGAAGTSDLNKSTEEMTADELELWKAQVDAEIAEAVTGDKQEPVVEGAVTLAKDAGKAPKGAPCLEYCRGPGHPKQIYDDHTELCPQHPDYEPGAITKSTTSKSAYASCKHERQKHFELEGGLHIYGSAYRDVKYITDAEVDVGVYMTDSWGLYPLASPGLDVPWGTKYVTKQVVLDWPDFGIPDDAMPMAEIVQWMLSEMAKGVKFETGCLGGHGRTGTMLSLLLVAQGLTPGKAIQRVRKDHCSKGVENKKQAEYVATFYKLFHGNEQWRKSKSERKLFNKMAEDGHKNYSSTTTSKGGWQGWSNGKWQGGNEEPVWREDLKLWTRKNYKFGYKWNSQLDIYTSPTIGGD